jgi:Tol biopolymer transport system component
MDLSDDARKVAFVSEITGDEEIYLADLSEQTILNVSSARGDDGHPRLSRDGARVLFESDRDRDTEIYLADIERKTLHNLTRRAGSDRFPCLSADGRRAVYRMGDGYYVDDLDGTPARPIAGTEHVWNLWIAADGRRAVFLRSRTDAGDQRTLFHAYVVDVD